ncbi:MAG: carboxypeptidase-like regulatory domain-containing protein, partial [Bacteroidota bacterium]|nr:carboxypeptidase-like regulatory domain-containing protein [Bacteroidota bacterium]
MRNTILMFIVLAFAIWPALLKAQGIILSGKVIDKSTNGAVTSASVRVSGERNGTITDSSGNFRLKVSSLPVTLLISSIGFEEQNMIINNASGNTIILVPFYNEIEGVTVIGPTKSQIRFLDVPVSAEFVGKSDFINTPSDSYWGSMLAKKGLDVTISSHTYKTYSTRGFNGSGSSRVNQFMDGMDNQAPGLNFSVGNFIGLTELDVENIEILPGASSALYGPGGLNGTILVNSKNPFMHQGLS